MAITGNVVCRSGYGAVRYYTSLPATNDALVIVLLKLAGLQDDDVIRDHATLAPLLAASNDECDATGYVRKTVTSGTTITPDDTNNLVDCDLPDQTWTALGTFGTPQSIGAFLVCYDPDTTTGDDSQLLVLTKHYYTKILDGSNMLLPLPNGFFRSAGSTG